MFVFVSRELVTTISLGGDQGGLPELKQWQSNEKRVEWLPEVINREELVAGGKGKTQSLLDSIKCRRGYGEKEDI